MVNEKTTEQRATNAEGNLNSGNQSEGADLVERARSQREGLVKENERLEKNLRELREIEASRLLGGTAGGRVEPVVREKTAKEYADEILSGKIKAK